MKEKFGFIIFFLCVLLCLFPIRTRASSPNFLYNLCSGSAFPILTTSQHQYIVKVLFSYLTSNASSSPTGFHSSVASLGSPGYVVYGIFLCRGDVSSDVCSDCVSHVTKYTLEECPGSEEVTIWYDECMIRYSHQDFSGKFERGGGKMLPGSSDVTDDPEGRFKDVLGETLIDTAALAAEGDGSGRKFAVGEGSFSMFDTVYALAQCTPDLTPLDCASCLNQCISNLTSCCVQFMGARAVFPTCNVRFETSRFYNTNSIAAPPPGSPSPRPIPPPPTPAKQKERKRPSKVLVAVVVAVGASVLLFILGFCLLTRRRPIVKKNDSAPSIDDGGNDITTEHSLQYDLGTIQAATNNFSHENKIGQGGFGSVYKGVLSNGQEVAVKRLSQNSGQGALEFKNEVVVVAKLQHRNLVRLRGFCLEGEEKILIYEFLPNKSLDYIIFDPQESTKLGWSQRYKIISGTARGMLYLHEDSRLRIIHRDLKASNVLLDADMNAKVSDFGMAKIFGGDQIQGSTSRVVGTFGYMSPEYAIHGHFSVKSDVYSFGVLLLEIISGKSNGSFYQSDRRDDLLSHAWKLWMEGNHLELVDPVLEGSYSNSEVTRCIHIGLLCVQEDADARPSMETVVMMLKTSYSSANLSAPQEPPFFPRGRSSGSIPNMTTDSIQSTYQSTPSSVSVNEVHGTNLHPR